MSRQQEADATVARIIRQVEKHGGQSDTLIELRKAYDFWYRLPGDNMAYALVLNELDRLEGRKNV